MWTLEKPEEHTRALKIIDRLIKGQKRTKANIPTDLRTWIMGGEYGWDIRLAPTPTAEIDRCGQILTGPLFTSKEYPWPIENGTPLVPGFQLDLKKIKRHTGIDLGGHEEILQVWAAQNDIIANRALFRLIPKNKVRKNYLTPVPKFPLIREHVFPVEWAAKDGISVQIGGYSAVPDFIMHCQLDDYEYDLSGNGLGRTTKALFRELKEILEGSWYSSPGSSCLFGAFSPIQYNFDPEQYPNEKVVLCLERGYGYEWGDMGNAQLYYRGGQEDRFSLSWSCF